MDDPKLNGTNAEAPDSIDRGRRRLGQAAIGGGALVLALRAGSVRAIECMSPSATMSAHPSGNQNQFMCSGRSPGAWKETWDKWETDRKLIGVANDKGWSFPWPSPYKGTDKFEQRFGYPALGMSGGNATLYDVLEAGGSDIGGAGLPNLSAYFVATLLNIATGDVPADVLTEAGLFEMYGLVYASGGFYTPYAGGSTWDPEKVKLYLSTTWDADASGDTIFTMLRGL